MVYKCFDKNSSGSGFKSEITPNQELAEELLKSIIRKFGKQKVYPSFKDSNWGLLLSTLYLKWENLYSAAKNLKFNLYQLKNNNSSNNSKQKKQLKKHSNKTKNKKTKIKN